MNQLNALKQVTTVVARHRQIFRNWRRPPRMPPHQPLVDFESRAAAAERAAVARGGQRFADAPLDDLMDRLLVRFGCEILAVVPGAFDRGGCPPVV